MVPSSFANIVILLAVSVSFSEGVAIPKNNLVFLGKFSANTVDREATQATSFYFLSQNAAGWATAGNDCSANLGDTASLVNIETAEELAEVTRIIASSDDTGSTYWTGGRFDSDSATFVWNNGVEIISTAPWDQGHPNTRTPVTRVLAYTVGGLKLRTDFQTVSLRYICELVA